MHAGSRLDAGSIKPGGAGAPVREVLQQDVSESDVVREGVKVNVGAEARTRWDKYWDFGCRGYT